MATQYNATQMRAAWDAAMTAYATLRGTAEADMMESGVDMTSVDVTGAWDLVDAVGFAALNPNNRVSATFTDGTDSLTFTYDELNDFGASGFIPKIDQYFGAHFKVWVILQAIKVAVEKAGINGTFTMPTPPAIWEWDDYKLLIDDLAGSTGRPEYSGLTSGLTSDALGASDVFPAKIE